MITRLVRHTIILVWCVAVITIYYILRALKIGLLIFQLPALIGYLLFTPVKKWRRRHIGKIFWIHPFHTVEPSDRIKYLTGKLRRGKNPLGARPHVVIRQKGNRVTLAKVYTDVSDKSIASGQKTKIETPGKHQGQGLSTTEYRKSEITGKDFKVGEYPLDKPEGRLNEADVNQNKKK